MKDSDSLFLDYLSAMAQADGTTTAEEQEIVHRLARYLGAEKSLRARRYQRGLSELRTWRPRTVQGRLDLFGMLAKLAWSDGVLQPVEERFLQQVARRFELESISAARILAEAEYRSKRHHRLRKQGLWGGGILATVLVVVAAVLAGRDPDPDQAAFREFENRYECSVLLLHVYFDTVDSAGIRSRHSSTGTGFFITQSGDAVTNKHVLQPWKFPGVSWDALALGAQLVPASYEVLAWSAGSEVLEPSIDGHRSLHRESAYSLGRGDLHVCALPEDQWVRRSGSALLVHAGSNADLALFRCDLTCVMEPLPLARDTARVAALDSVLVIGFPRGLQPLELERARCSPVIGWVRKGEDTIQISAPIHPGNSGGPLVDTAGQVTGIATRISAGDATMGQCIRAEHIRGLLALQRYPNVEIDRAALTVAPPAAH